MRLKHCIQLLMLALLLVTFQKVTIHSTQHLSEAASECHLCYVSDHLDLHQHQESSPFIVNEHIAIQERITEEKQIVQDAYDLGQKPIMRMTDYDGLVIVGVDIPTLGYFPTAPPSIFS